MANHPEHRRDPRAAAVCVALGFAVGCRAAEPPATASPERAGATDQAAVSSERDLQAPETPDDGAVRREPATGELTLPGPVAFEVDRDVLILNDRRGLEALRDFLQRRPEVALTIEVTLEVDPLCGGSLARRRAEAIRNYLVAGGIAPERIVSRGSARRSCATGEAAAGHALRLVASTPKTAPR